MYFCTEILEPSKEVYKDHPISSNESTVRFKNWLKVFLNKTVYREWQYLNFFSFFFFFGHASYKDVLKNSIVYNIFVGSSVSSTENYIATWLARSRSYGNQIWMDMCTQGQKSLLWHNCGTKSDVWVTHREMNSLNFRTR